MENEFIKLRQGNMTVRKYDEEFDRLSQFIGRFMDEESLSSCF